MQAIIDIMDWINYLKNWINHIKNWIIDIINVIHDRAYSKRYRIGLFGIFTGFLLANNIKQIIITREH